VGGLGEWRLAVRDSSVLPESSRLYKPMKQGREGSNVIRKIFQHELSLPEIIINNVLLVLSSEKKGYLPPDQIPKI
jgi:hypothetical protein